MVLYIFNLNVLGTLKNNKETLKTKKIKFMDLNSIISQPLQ